MKLIGISKGVGDVLGKIPSLREVLIVYETTQCRNAIKIILRDPGAVSGGKGKSKLAPLIRCITQNS